MYQQSAICSTLNNVPMSASSLEKSRLPLALHIFPFASDENMPISNDVVRCQVCRAYINPYVRLDQRTWQCNICNRNNELPVEFIYDYQQQQYYDLQSRPELTSLAIEYIAGLEYTTRPPPPAVYMFVFDCSRVAIELGYIPLIAIAISDLLEQIPGDARASIGFLGYDSSLHYFSFMGSKVVHYISPDISSTILPCTRDGILVNLTSNREMLIDFLTQQLAMFPFDSDASKKPDNRSAFGPAVKTAMKIIAPTGGRITIIQSQLPNHGCADDGSILLRREDPTVKKNIASDKNGDYLTPLINPASDFYKNLALEACESQISIDIFNLSNTYVDLATVSQLCKFTAGSVFHYSNTVSELKTTLIRFDQDFRNQIVRPIGLEAVLRVRHTRGFKLASFHGNFFVRSANLLCLPNLNPDASYALQVTIEEDLPLSTKFAYFQTCLLYTTPEGERRIRVHTARYPTVTTFPEVIYGANQTAIVAILAKMAVDRSQQASIGEAKEALIGAGVDLLEVFSLVDEMRARSYPYGLPENLRLVPLYILALLKHIAFKISFPVRLDDRYAAMERFKTLPVDDLITYIYPDLFPLHGIATDQNEDWRSPLQLTAAQIERNGAYLLDAYDVMIIFICEYIDPRWCYEVFGVNEFAAITEYQDVYTTNQSAQSGYHSRNPANFRDVNSAHHGTNDKDLNPVTKYSIEEITEAQTVMLPELDNPVSSKIRDFINYLVETRPQKPKFYILKEKSRAKSLFTQYLYDDRTENYHSYAEFWKFLQDQARK